MFTAEKIYALWVDLAEIGLYLFERERPFSGVQVEEFGLGLRFYLFFLLLFGLLFLKLMNFFVLCVDLHYLVLENGRTLGEDVKIVKEKL